MRLAAIEHRHRAHLDVDLRAVLADALNLEVHRLAGDHAAVHLARELVVVMAGEDPALLAHDLLARVAAEYGHRGVDVDHARVLVA